LTEAQEEDIYGTSDTNPDTDGDGYLDGAEVTAQVDPNDPNSFPNQPPVFEDAIIELAENSVEATQVYRFSAKDEEGDVVTFSIVTNADPDEDGNEVFILEEDRLLVNDPGDLDFENISSFDVVIEATDGKSPENANFTINLIDDRTEDADGDGLTEAQEEDDYGTLDTNPDTDGDTYTDKEEVTFNSNPNSAQKIPYVNLTVLAQGGGTVAGSGSYPLRTVVNITATPDLDYAFNGWTGDVSSAENPFGVLMDDNKIVRTRFVDSMVDDDNDGLSNLAERITHRTDPNNADTDGDGLTDGKEVLETLSDPKKIDTDNDGLTDLVETATLSFVSRDDTGTNPNDPDTDGDGLSDGCEVKGFTSYSIVKGTFRWLDALDDAEDRGGHLATFADRDEWRDALKAVGDNPFDDFASIWIGAEKKGNEWEWLTGEKVDFNQWGEGQPSNQTKALLAGEKARGRPAGTWYTNTPSERAGGYFLEVTESPDPTNPDTDGDGILDGDEDGVLCERITDPFIEDKDKDGWKDEVEILFGSSPDSSKSVPEFRLKTNILESGQLELLFPGEKATRYTIQTSADMKDWVSLEKLIIGQGDTIRERFQVSGDVGFFRVIRE
ncbi:MAG: InlB B-repeat-containing protein, partial [Verrucomicrobiales bacterium]